MSEKDNDFNGPYLYQWRTGGALMNVISKPDIGKSKLSKLHRLTILFDGEVVLGATVAGEKPKNSKELHDLLQELIDMENAPEVSDPEILK